MTRAQVLTDRATVPLLLLALLMGAMAVALETAFRVPLRLPGHRAFPGALALLLLAQTFAPWLLALLAAAVPLVLHLLGAGPLWAVAGWLVPAALFVLLTRSRPPHLISFALLGLLFGLLRYLGLPGVAHHTPEALRLGGHLCFGAGGALVAYGAARLLPPARRRDS